MPLMNQDGTKECSTCRQVKVAKGNFYASSSTKDHWQYRCIECWAKPTAETKPVTVIAVDGTEKQVVRQPKVPTGFSHSAADIKEVEQNHQVRFHEWLDIGGVKIPVMHSITNPPAAKKHKEA